ncbi:hypothetical protein NOI87_31580 [Neorhizobium galegae]|nr:hypothetical protein [Neorhizobium galegae]MCQ1799738.1 hypothetical protein [Neorhizobium galegae]
MALDHYRECCQRVEAVEMRNLFEELTWPRSKVKRRNVDGFDFDGMDWGDDEVKQ